MTEANHGNDRAVHRHEIRWLHRQFQWNRGYAFHDADHGYTEFMTSLNDLVMGRKTWEQANTFESVAGLGSILAVIQANDQAAEHP